jgi:uncharacterized OsmC-like protein
VNKPWADAPGFSGCHFEEQPEKAKSKPTVKAHTDGSQAVMEAGPFSLRSDLPEPIGGTNQAPSPTALLLSALAGCAAVFMRDTLAPAQLPRIHLLGTWVNKW